MSSPGRALPLAVRIGLDVDGLAVLGLGYGIPLNDTERAYEARHE